MGKRALTVIFQAILLVILVVGLSAGSVRWWGGKVEKAPENREFTFKAGVTLGEFGRMNHLPDKALGKVFGLKNRSDLQKPLDSFGLDQDTITARLNRAMALIDEEASKNWKKILAKFLIWIIFLSLTFILLKRGVIDSRKRNILYLAATLIFGAILGSDPNAMGTVKDAVYLYASQGVIFPPRMIAFSVFLLMVILANKFICSWGCQFGAFQDLLFRLGRDPMGRASGLPKYKMPFVITNTIRVLFLAVFVVVAFAWKFDLIGPVDPFKMFNPWAIGVAGIIAVAALLTASLFVCRPWRHLFCPFGLVGWLAEKISLYKIKVDYQTCIACEKCVSACPSTVMGAILWRDRTTPDCFSCGSCIESCPTDSIKFAPGRRNRPPKGHFDRKKKNGQ